MKVHVHGDRYHRRTLLWLGRPAGILFVCLGFATAAQAQDRQSVQLGNGLANSLCISPGLNGVRQSSPSGDDGISGENILSGLNGICESTPGGDDAYPTDSSLGNGSAFKQIIGPGVGNLCRSPVVLQNDDQRRVLDPVLDPLGTGLAYQAAVRPDPDTTIESVPGGDDVLTALVCPGADGTIESAVVGDDVLSGISGSDQRCGICPFGATLCITPGPNDALASIAVGSDAVLQYVSAGANGRSQTAKAVTDVQSIPVGQGHPNTICVDSGADGIADTTLCGNGIADLDENGILADAECDDGASNSDVIPDACRTDCRPARCGDNVADPGNSEQCDDGVANSDITPDACRTTCRNPSCGDGVTDASNGEECEDGNTKNNDDCLVAQNCVLAICGDGFTHTRGTPPFEECDDGNNLAGDGCDAACALEPLPGCGDGTVDTQCSTGTVGASCTVNADCDVTPGDGTCVTEECDDGNSSDKDDCLHGCRLSSCGDGITKTKGTPPYEECDDGNNQPGDGCSASCVGECGNGVVDGACSQGTVGGFCQTNADCDVAPGDGVCVTEACDIATDGICLLTPVSCSGECTLTTCGNGIVECTEQCDLGPSNGVVGSGCATNCERNVIGPRELTNLRECPAAWTLDSPPQPATQRSQYCKDGSSCDFDGVADGACTFSVGLCLNRSDPAGCKIAPIVSVDLTGLKTSNPAHAAAAQTLTDAIAALTYDDADVPGRCRTGLRGKNCSLRNTDCDSHLGAGDGICDVGTGVAFAPVLILSGVGANQVNPCTPGQFVEVPADTMLRLSALVRRADGIRGDRDVMRLFCRP